MDIQQILKVLKNERECIKRQSEYSTTRSFVPKCDRDCANCDLCLPDDEILEVYDFLINSYSMQEVHIKVSPEEADKLIEILNRNAKDHIRFGVLPYPDMAENISRAFAHTQIRSAIPGLVEFAKSRNGNGSLRKEITTNGR